jgi:hypothetical protein
MSQPILISAAMLFLGLLLLPTVISPQATINEKLESGTAYARIVAARNGAKAVTAEQCLSNLSSWQATDEADRKSKVAQPNWWYQKLSTEELARLSADSHYCFPVLLGSRRQHEASLIIDYAPLFSTELLRRAEGVLIKHHLVNEYLLMSSE